VSLLASVATFERKDGLYWPPYAEYPFHRQRAELLAELYEPRGQKLAIWGCGYGYTVRHARLLGFDAYGFDASRFALKRARERLPKTHAAHVFRRDATIEGDVEAALEDARVSRRFELLVTEDMLPCLDDSEIRRAVSLLREVADQVVHMVTPMDRNPRPARDPRINWKHLDTWRDFMRGAVLFDAEHNEVVS
jgi:hypothetical protein